MENLYVALDFGSSSLKCLYSKELSGVPEYLVMGPESIKVIPEAIERYRQKGGFQGEVIAHSFVGIEGIYYAVGSLAQKEFQAIPVLGELKSFQAVQRALAAVWVAAQRSGLGRKFRLLLSCLLPPGEYQDRTKLEEDLRQALKGFDTPTGKHQISMPFFNCHPEGTGLSMWYLSKRGEMLDRKLGVVMLGHRNASCFVVESKVCGKFRPSDLGFAMVVRSIQQATSGYKEEDITRVVASYWATEDETQLNGLLLQKTEEARAVEKERLVKAIEIARSIYWNSLSQWLAEKMVGVDEVTVGGGVTALFQEEIRNYFRERLPNLPGEKFCGIFLDGGLKIPDNTTIPSELHSRFADVYCLWERDIHPNAVRYSALQKEKDVPKVATRMG
jgi:hypothetical protein